MATQHIPVRFLILSDTHNLNFDTDSIAFTLPMPKVDVVLHCGDLTQVGGSSAFKDALNMLSSIEAEKKLVIAGNHDLDLDPEYWRTSLQEGDDPTEIEREHLEEHAAAMEIMKGRLAIEAGVTYLDEGTHSFTLRSGATFTVYASPYTPEFNKWAFSYGNDEDRFNLPGQGTVNAQSIAQHPVPSFPNIDIMMTHGPPKGILDHCDQGHMGCKHLLKAIQRARPRMHCFGHIHEGYGARVVKWDTGEEKEQRNMYPASIEPNVVFGEETLMVNAAIQDGEGKFSNVPWIVDVQCSMRQDAGK